MFLMLEMEYFDSSDFFSFLLCFENHLLVSLLWDFFFFAFAFKDLAKLLRLEEKDFHKLETLLENYKKENTQTTTQLTDEKDDMLSVKIFLEYLEYEKDVITIKDMEDGEYVALGKSCWALLHYSDWF